MAKPARSAQRRSWRHLAGAGCIGVLFAGCAQTGATASATPPPPVPSAEVQTLQQLQQDILLGVNRVRVAKGLGELVADPDLDRIAELYSAELATRGSIGHFSDTPFRQTLRERLRAERVSYTAAGENLARMSPGADVAIRTVRSWQNSPGHNRNLLEPRYGRSGLGATRDTAGIYYIVQVYASRF